MTTRGNRLKEIRARRGMIQLRLSLESGIKATDISLFENEWKKPTPEQIRRMATVLEVTPEELGFER